MFNPPRCSLRSISMLIVIAAFSYAASNCLQSRASEHSDRSILASSPQDNSSKQKSLDEAVSDIDAKDYIAAKVRKHLYVIDLSSMVGSFSPKNRDLEPLKDAFSVKSISLKGLPIDDTGLEYLRPLKLTNLNLESTNVEKLNALSSMTSLTVLSVARTRIATTAIEMLSHLPNLEKLNLETTQISDSDLARLRSLHKLKELDLSDCEELSEHAVEKFRSDSPNCAIAFSVNSSANATSVMIAEARQRFMAGDFVAAGTKYARAAMDLKNSKNRELRADCLSKSGDCKYVLKQYAVAAILYEEARKLVETTNPHSSELAELCTKRAICLEFLDRQSESIPIRKKADELFRNRTATNTTVPVQNAIAENLLYLSIDSSDLGNVKESVGFYNQGLKVCKAHKLNESELSNRAALHIGGQYFRLHQYKNAASFLTQVLEFYAKHRSADHDRSRFEVQQSLVECYEKLFDYKSAQSLLQTLITETADPNLKQKFSKDLADIQRKH